MQRFDTIRSECRYVDGRRLWFGRAVLTGTAVEVSGWMGLRRFGLRIALDDVAGVSRRLDARRSNLSLLMENGPTLSVLVSAPGLWRLEVMQRIRALHPERSGDADESVLGASPVPPQVSGSAEPGPTLEPPVDDRPVPIEEPAPVEPPIAHLPDPVAASVPEPVEPTRPTMPESLAYRADVDYEIPRGRAAELGIVDELRPVAEAAQAQAPVEVRTTLTGWKRLRDLDGESEGGA